MLPLAPAGVSRLSKQPLFSLRNNSQCSIPARRDDSGPMTSPHRPASQQIFSFAGFGHGVRGRAHKGYRPLLRRNVISFCQAPEIKRDECPRDLGRNMHYRDFGCERKVFNSEPVLCVCMEFRASRASFASPTILPHTCSISSDRK